MSCKQQREAHQFRMIDFCPQVGQPPVRDRFKRCDRHQRMFVHGVAMIEIAHHQAFDVAPLRNRRSQRAGFLHGAQSHGRLWELKQALPILPVARESRAVEPVDRIRREAKLMPRHELEQAPVREFPRSAIAAARDRATR